MRGVRILLASITLMLLALIGIIGGGQGGLVITYIAAPVSLILMFIGLCIDERKKDENNLKDKIDEINSKKVK